jgi:hypothetical protein
VASVGPATARASEEFTHGCQTRSCPLRRSNQGSIQPPPCARRGVVANFGNNADGGTRTAELVARSPIPSKPPASVTDADATARVVPPPTPLHAGRQRGARRRLQRGTGLRAAIIVRHWRSTGAERLLCPRLKASHVAQRITCTLSPRPRIAPFDRHPSRRAVALSRRFPHDHNAPLLKVSNPHYAAHLKGLVQPADLM